MRALLWLLAASAAWAQRPAFVYVTSAGARLVAGQSFASKATAVDANGATLSNQTWVWSSSDDKLVSVDSNGQITAKFPGIADVIATASGVRGTVRVQVLPALIEVSPADREVAPGDQIEYRARVLNSRGEELEGVPLQWTVTGADGFNNNGVSMGRNGILSAFGVGRFNVRAAIVYATGPGQFVPQFAGSARVDVRQPGTWRVRRIAASNDTRDGMLLRSSSNAVAVGGDGLLALSASLDGLANGIVTSRGGALEVWAASGAAGVRPGTVIMTFDNPAANRRGEVAATSVVVGTGSYGTANNLLLVTRDGPHFLTLAGTSDAGVDIIRPQGTTRFSLNDNTQCAFTAAYRHPVTRVDRVGIFMVDSDVYHQLLVPADAVLPGLTGPYTFDRDFALDNAGVLIFVVFQAGNRHVYRRTITGAYERVAGTGDKVAGNTITQASQVAISPAGHFAYHLYTANAGHYLVLHRLGEAPRTLPLSDLRQVFHVSLSGEVLYYGNGGAGPGVYGWDGAQSRAIALLGRLTPSEDPLTEITSASFGAGPDVIVHGTTPRRDLLIYRAMPNPAVLIESGARTFGPAGLAFESLVPGSKQGPPYLRNVYSRSGAIEPGTPAIAIVAPGDRLPEGGRFDGNLLQRTPDGDLLLTTATSLQRLNPATSRSLFRFPYSMDGGTLYGAALAAANRSGVTAMLVNNSFPSQRLVMVENGAPRLIAHIGGGDPNFRTSSPAGGVFAANRQLSVDERGRVIALMDVNGGPAGVFAYEQGAWKPLLIAGNKIGSDTVVSIDLVRVAGSRVFARYAIAGNFVSLAAEEADGWTRRFGRGDASPTGNIAGNPGAFEVLEDGRIAVSFSAGGMVCLGVQRPGQDIRVVVLGNAPTGDGDLFLTVDSVDLRDDGRIYFTGLTAGDRLVAYVAEPIQ